ncbi:hypothetical protein B9G98_03188 [Wickerhamiella sorbophila]|uniref:Uncharacterized protein n=1 Tax=Wickerhamiella sorbophila TaxID=45607 RepID=A0A2T0FKQ7_9ASCO|nr:hypothetical protein B9G98_03188 [Wickerhamiella sorbophila]PRT55568.1 hypothetical protein B9G98_03188 [Wickerhamiella sorbophila]
MRDNWQLATVLQFVSTFSGVYEFPVTQVDVIEDDLSGKNDPLVQLPDLARSLADAAGVASHIGNLEAWLAQDSATKIADLYEMVLNLLSAAKCRDALESGEAEARILPIGTAGTGKRPRIFYLLDDNRIYTVSGKRWKCAAWDVESWHALIRELEAAKPAKNKPLRDLLAYLRPVLPIVEKYHRGLATDSRRRAKHRRIAIQVENRKRSSRLLEAQQVEERRTEAAAVKAKVEEERLRRQAEQDKRTALEDELNALRQLLLEHEGRVTRLYEQRAARFVEIATDLGLNETPPERPTEEMLDVDFVSTLKI